MEIIPSGESAKAGLTVSTCVLARLTSKLRILQVNYNFHHSKMKEKTGMFEDHVCHASVIIWRPRDSSDKENQDETDDGSKTVTNHKREILFEAIGVGQKKKEAKHKASAAILCELKLLNLPELEDITPKEYEFSMLEMPTIDEPFDVLVKKFRTCKPGLVGHSANKNFKFEYEFVQVEENGMTSRKVVAKCSTEDDKFSVEATGSSKRYARKKAMSKLSKIIKNEE